MTPFDAAMAPEAHKNTPADAASTKRPNPMLARRVIIRDIETECGGNVPPDSADLLQGVAVAGQDIANMLVEITDEYPHAGKQRAPLRQSKLARFGLLDDLIKGLNREVRIVHRVDWSLVIASCTEHSCGSASQPVFSVAASRLRSRPWSQLNSPP